MSDDAPRWASFSSAFSIILSSASDRIAELGCAPVGEDPKAFVDSGGLRRLESRRPRRRSGEFARRPTHSSSSCLAPKCLAANNANSS